ncbi:MAG: YkgJ family cysteine cluster protein [Thermoleophilia bacterium]|nr:YkgJ family cysteine cluster protein [Thermoleophilia bacterium]
MQDTSKVVKEKLTPGSKLTFKCHPGIACFTKCCSNIDILLTPYDVIRMKNRFGISSTEFLADYTHSVLDKKTSQPLLYIRLLEDGEQRCPFVDASEGCTIYSDRPAACRYYPVGQVTHRRMDDKNESPIHDEFYVVVREDHCLGFQEDKTWTIQEWREDQEAALCDEMNREWKNIMMKQDLPRGEVFDQKRQTMFYIASYDIDGFRQFVFESRFLEIFDVDAETLDKISNDEIELMNFSFRYLKYLLGIHEEIELQPRVADEQKKLVMERKAKEAAERAALIAEEEAKKTKDETS